jgi:serine protease Do
MKSGKACCLAIGVFLGASVIPGARAQNPNDRQNSPQGSKSEQSQGQQQGASNSPNDKSSQRQAGSKQPQHQAGQNQSNKSQDPYAAQGWDIVLGEGNLRNFVPTGWQDSWHVSALQVEPNLATADDSVREHLNLPKGQGIVVNAVAPNSGAAQVGIQQNDILLMLGDSPLGKPKDLYDRLKQAGEKPVSLTLLRSGSRVTLEVQPLVRVSLTPVAAPAREYWIGISVAPLEPVLRAQLRLSPNHKVLVNEVFPDSPAAKAGITRHDIIVALDGNPVSEPSDVANSVQAKGEKPLMLEVISKGGKSRTVAVTPERKKVAETSQSHTIPLLGNAELNNVVTYDVVLPGVIMDNTAHAITALNQSYLGQVPIISNSNQKSQDAGPALTQRLDALDSELKELRKVVEALQKAATKIIEQKKSSAE